MTDPMHLLRAANPVRDCDAPDFERLLGRLEHEPRDRPLDDAPPATRGTLFGLRSNNLPRIAAKGTRPVATGRRALAALLPVAVALAVAAAALVSLHGSTTTHHSAPSGSLAYDPGQAHGHVLRGSMHQYLYVGSGAHNETWGAEWFRTTDDQICVQAGRQVGSRLGYVDFDRIRHNDGRFHAWPPNTAVDARCIDRPAHGGVALMVVERVADSGHELPPSGACTAAEHGRCPARDTTTLYFGVLGSSVAMAGYGSERDSDDMNLGPGPDGEYIQAFPGGERGDCLSTTPCQRHAPAQLVHPGARAFVLYSGQKQPCVLRGPGTGGVLSGDCPDGLTIGPSPERLTVAQVRARVHVTTRTTAHQVLVTARFRTRVASSQIADYSMQLSTPATGCAGHEGGSSSSSFGLSSGFHAGQLLTEGGSAPRCSGTYHGAITVQPHVGSWLTVARFSFKEPRAH